MKGAKRETITLLGANVCFCKQLPERLILLLAKFFQDDEGLYLSYTKGEPMHGAATAYCK